MAVKVSRQGVSNTKDRILLFVVLFIPCLLINQVLDNDIWFILNNGRYVLQNGIPYTEPFTLHQGMSYVMQQWLTSVIFWVIYSTFGAFGLTFFTSLVEAGIIYAVFRLSMRISEDNFFVSYAVSLFISVFISPFMVQRPYIFLLLIIAIEMYLLESYISTRNVKYLFYLPLLSVLQINLQAAMWPVLFIVLIPYIIDSFKFKLLFIKGQGYSRKSLFIIIAIMFLVGFINPYRVDGMTYLFRSYGYKEISSLVLEMKAPNINDLWGMVIYGCMFCLILVYCVYKKGKTRLRYVLLSMGTAVMTLSSIRSFSLFSICGIAPLAYYLKNVSLPKTNAHPSRNLKVLRKILILLLCIAIGVGMYSKYRSTQKQVQNMSLSGVVNYLLKNTDTKNIVLYTGYNDGNYAEFMGLKPYIDARAEVFIKKNNKKDDIMREYYLLQSGGIFYRNVLDKYNFTHLIVSKNDILDTYLPYDEDYKIIYSDEYYKVFEKN
ncbi:hypothetical protein ACHOLT_15395 [Desulfitobacterium sp. Sab5]|uniref:hypothetical protein n=1 Tax=Desulfitobacterium nosdiversum TaxID=3375356 RepID=UPI003CE711FE